MPNLSSFSDASPHQGISSLCGPAAVVCAVRALGVRPPGRTSAWPLDLPQLRQLIGRVGGWNFQAGGGRDRVAAFARSLGVEAEVESISATRLHARIVEVMEDGAAVLIHWKPHFGGPE